MATKTKNKRTPPASSPYGDPKVWSAGIDWDEWKEEFFTSREEDSSYTYRSLHRFAMNKFPDLSKMHRRFRKWFMWSCSTHPSKYIEYQGDWIAERITHKSRLSQQLQSLETKIQSELDIIDAGKILADSYLPLQQRVFDLWKELETHTGGAIIRDTSHELNEKKRKGLEVENQHRLTFYLGTLNKIIDMKLKIDNQFLRALGWDRPQFIAYFDAIRRGQDSVAQKGSDDAVTKLMVELTKNQIEKSKMYELEMPREIEVISEEMDKEEKVHKNGNGNGTK